MFNFQVRSLELLLEEEQEEKQLTLREKREVERRLQTLNEQKSLSDNGETKTRITLR